jgi:predicted DsbA family dithiol-disulfide isomerase
MGPGIVDPDDAPVTLGPKVATTPSMSQLDVYSDVACPWCFIGKRRLDQALAALPERERPTVRWHAYQLQPDFPLGEAKPARAMLEAKFGGAARFAQMFERVQAIAAQEGIHYDLDRQQAVNTSLAHRAVAIARRYGKESAAVEAFFAAFFEQGHNLADLDVVAAILARALADVPGIDAAGLAQQLRDGAGEDEVQADLKDARLLGVSGVPFFILDERLAMSGAQDVTTFLSFLAEGQRRRGGGDPAQTA